MGSEKLKKHELGEEKMFSPVFLGEGKDDHSFHYFLNSDHIPINPLNFLITNLLVSASIFRICPFFQSSFDIYFSGISI